MWVTTWQYSPSQFWANDWKLPGSAEMQMSTCPLAPIEWQPPRKQTRSPGDGKLAGPLGIQVQPG